jgi:hypothetical protein
LLAGISIGGISFGVLQQGANSDCLRTQRLEIVGKDGRTCCIIGSRDDGSVELVLAAADAGPRILLRVGNDGAAFSGIEARPGERCGGMTAQGKDSVMLHLDIGHQQPAVIASASASGAMIGLADSSGDVTWSGEVDRAGTARLSIGAADAGQVVAASDKTDTASVQVTDKTGAVLVKLPR